MQYLLDTCTVSYLLRKDEKVIQNLQNKNPERILISSITIHEVEYGLKLNPQKALKIQPFWDDFCKEIKILPYDADDAKSAAIIRAYLKQRGEVIGNFDVLIASVALSKNLVCVTSNVFEFSRVPRLVIQDWRNSPIIS